MSEKKENKTPKSESEQAKNPSNQNNVQGPPPAPPVEEMGVTQSESDLDLLKEELPKPVIEPIEELEPIIPTTPIDPELQDAIIKDTNSGTSFKEAAKKDFEEATEEIPEDENVFKYPLDGREKTAYENILKSNRETIKSLRNQVQEGNAKIAELTAELEAKNKEV